MTLVSFRSCASCPWLDWTEETFTWRCGHANGKDQDLEFANNILVPPDWCPVRLTGRIEHGTKEV